MLLVLQVGWNLESTSDGNARWRFWITTRFFISSWSSSAKSNYTTTIAHFLAIIAAHPQLEEKLHYCGAYKIPRDVEGDSENVHHICFGFDEALETFGVRF